MTLTRRGEKVVATLAVFGLVTFLLTCAIIGQHLKQDRLAEDDPGWDCATMGNEVCG